MDELAEVGTATKGGNERGLREDLCGLRDAKIRSKEHDEASDNNLLGLKATKQLVAHQPQRGVTEARGEAPNWRGRRNRPRTATRHGRRGSWDFFYICALSEKKETWTMPPATMGATTPWFTGAGSKTC